QTAWWVMNDVGNGHEETGTAPLGVEVRVTAFSVRGPRVPPHGGVPTVDQATFYRYLVTNRTDAVIDSAYASIFADVDLGDASDDYVGSDTLRHMGYVYNADNFDGGSLGYG